jgi:hypothetical protein
MMSHLSLNKHLFTDDASIQLAKAHFTHVLLLTLLFWGFSRNVITGFKLLYKWRNGEKICFWIRVLCLFPNISGCVLCASMLISHIWPDLGNYSLILISTTCTITLSTSSTTIILFTRAYYIKMKSRRCIYIGGFILIGNLLHSLRIYHSVSPYRDEDQSCRFEVSSDWVAVKLTIDIITNFVSSGIYLHILDKQIRELIRYRNSFHSDCENQTLLDSGQQSQQHGRTRREDNLMRFSQLFRYGIIATLIVTISSVVTSSIVLAKAETHASLYIIITDSE